MSNKGRDTRPELAVRHLLHAYGLRYRVNFRPLPTLRRTADIVFTRHRMAIFLDGCFWHGCPQHATLPKRNADYWTPKLERNVERDRDTNEQLRAAGWTVLRYWEHEDPSKVAGSIIGALRARRCTS